MIGEPALPSIAGLGLEPVDEVDHVVEPAAGAGSNAASGNRDGKMRLAGAGPTDQHGVALLGDEAAAGEVVECVAEAFDTTFNILLLVYPVRALTRATVIP